MVPIGEKKKAVVFCYAAAVKNTLEDLFSKSGFLSWDREMKDDHGQG